MGYASSSGVGTNSAKRRATFGGNRYFVVRNEYYYTVAIRPGRVGSHNQRLDRQPDELRISTR